MKAYVYETFEQLGRIPANIVIPVGNGTLFIGAVKALEHLHASGAIERFPNIIALQSEKCDPLYRAREAGLEDPARVTPAPTMAEGIAIGVPILKTVESTLSQIRRRRARGTSGLWPSSP